LQVLFYFFLVGCLVLGITSLPFLFLLLKVKVGGFSTRFLCCKLVILSHHLVNCLQLISRLLNLHLML